MLKKSIELSKGDIITLNDLVNLDDDLDKYDTTAVYEVQTIKKIVLHGQDERFPSDVKIELIDIDNKQKLSVFVPALKYWSVKKEQ